MSIEAIVFDVDGVVVNASRFSDIYVKDYGIDISLMKPFFQGEFVDCKKGKKDLQEVLDKYLFKWKWQGTVSEFIEYWLKSGDRVNQQMLGFIGDLRKQGVKCFLGTNQEKHRLEYLKKEMNFGDCFDGIVCSSEVGFLKPEDEFFDALLKQISKDESVLKRDILIVDDSEEVISLADEYGFQAYLYSDFNQFKAFIEKFKNPAVFSGVF